MVPLGDTAEVEARFGLSDIELILMQDRCMVCVERNIGSENQFAYTRWSSEIVLDATDGTTRYKAQVEAHFSPFRDSANLDAR